MSFESGMREELSGVAGLANKIFPANAPEQTSAPYLVYLSSEGGNYKTLIGFLPIKHVDVELNVVCSSYAEMKSMTSAVILKVQSFVGRTVGTSEVFVQDVEFPQEPAELFEAEVRLHRCVINFTAYF